MKKTPCYIVGFILLLILVLVSPIVLSVNASENNNVAISSTEFYVQQGETFTTTIFIADNANIVEFELHLIYDTEKLSLISAEENENIKGAVIFNVDTVGQIDINYTRTSANVTSKTLLVDLTFVVNENLASGTYDCLKVDDSKAYVAYRLVNGGKQKVDFDCDFSPLVIYEMGDVDLSNNVDIGDAGDIRRYLAKFINLTDFQMKLADTSFDGVIDIADAICLQRHLARFDVVYGDRVNVTFYDVSGNELVKKSVVRENSLNSIPVVPLVNGYTNGRWSLSATGYIAPNYSNITEAMSVYAVYDQGVSEAMQWYMDSINSMVNGYNGKITTNWALPTSYTYVNDNTKTCVLRWATSNANVFDTSGHFTQPTYDTVISLTAELYSYNNGVLESSTKINYSLTAKGAYSTPTKTEIVNYLKGITGGTVSTDGISSVTGGQINCDLNLVKKITNEQVGSSVSYEVRVEWAIDDNGTYEPISQIKRGTSTKIIDLVAVISFNGTPLDGDGKVYFDDVTLTAITEDEIRYYVINQIADNVAVSLSTGDHLWDTDTMYGCNVKWVSGNTSLVTIEQNTVTVNAEAVNGISCPIKVQVSYSTDDDINSFELEYSVTINTSNEQLKGGVNISEALYLVLLGEMRTRYGINTLTTAALKNEKFVYLDLSQYKDGVIDPTDTSANPRKLYITDLTGLTYCENLYVLNISGLNISNGLSEICTLNNLESLIANNCDISELTSGGTPVLSGMINLKLLDLSDNNLSSLDSVLADDTVYGRLKEIYLNNNQLSDISQLSNAPFVEILTLSNNELDSNNLTVLSSLTYLKYLSLADNTITDISALSQLKNLTELRLQRNNISDISALKDMTAMKTLYLGDNRITNVSKLDKLTCVTTLYLNNNPELENVDVVANMTGLTVLNVSGNNIDNLSAVSSLTGLVELYAERNKIRSFAFVKNLTNLNKLLLANNSEPGDESDSMGEYLSELSKLTVLTLSGKKLNSLDFLLTTDSNKNTTAKPIVRLELADCSLPAYYITSQTDSTVTGYVDNLDMIAGLKQTLLYLDISGNGFSYNIDGFTFSSGKPSKIDVLRNLSNLQLFYADNTDVGSNITSLMSMMSRVRYLSMEHCGISDITWLTKSAYYVFADMANNPITSFNYESIKRSLPTLQYLYLDSTATNSTLVCDDTSAYNENILVALSLRNIGISDMNKLPKLTCLKYLDVSQANTNIFTKSNLELLYQNYNDIYVNLYADSGVYGVPSGHTADGVLNATRETLKLNELAINNALLIKDFTMPIGGNIVDYRDNGYPLGQQLSVAISGYDITWSLENNYLDVVDGKLKVVNIAIPEENYVVELIGGISIYGTEQQILIPVEFYKEKYSITYVLDSANNSFSHRTATNSIENPVEYAVDGNVVVINDPTRGEYDEFLGWYLDDSYTIPFENNLHTNPRNVTLYAKWNTATYYDSFEEVSRFAGAIGDYKVLVIDWSSYKSGTYKYIGNTDNTAFDISGAVEIHFIGSPDSIYEIDYICLASYEVGQNVKLYFDNFNYIGYLGSYYGDCWQDAGMFLTIDVSGNSSISAPVNITAIKDFKNLTITGDGTLNVYGGDGADGTSAGASGTDGGIGIRVNNLTIDMVGNLFIYGGNGGKGIDGTNGNKGDPSYNGHSDRNATGGGANGGNGTNGTDGGNGGKGGYAYVVTSIVINNGNTLATGGKSGDGGKGGDGGAGGQGQEAGGWGTTAGNGGKGGDGAKGGNTYIVAASDGTENIISNDGTLSLVDGKAGTVGGAGAAGAGGARGMHCDAENCGQWATGGNDGNNGDPGEAGSAGNIITSVKIALDGLRPITAGNSTTIS